MELDGTAGPNPPDPYYENTPADSAVWTAVWEKVPTVMPGSVTDDDGKTRYRIAETVPGGYQTVNGSPHLAGGHRGQSRSDLHQCEEHQPDGGEEVGAQP